MPKTIIINLVQASEMSIKFTDFTKHGSDSWRVSDVELACLRYYNNF